MSDWDLIVAYRKDNADLQRKLEMAEQYVANNTVLLARALKAEALIKRLVELGNVLVDQNDIDSGAVMAAEDEWREIVAEWRKGKQ